MKVLILKIFQKNHIYAKNNLIKKKILKMV
jgi:hypothetical protein